MKTIWPCSAEIIGFEIHHGVTELEENQTNLKINPIFKDLDLGWYKKNSLGGTIAGTYIHGIFENDAWRNEYFNLIMRCRNKPLLDKKTKSYRIKRDTIINNLANEFDKHLNLSSILN